MIAVLEHKKMERQIPRYTLRGTTLQKVSLVTASCNLGLALCISSCLETYRILESHSSATHPYFHPASRYSLSRWALGYVILLWPQVSLRVFCGEPAEFVHKRPFSGGGESVGEFLSTWREWEWQERIPYWKRRQIWSTWTWRRIIGWNYRHSIQMGNSRLYPVPWYL